MSCGRPKCASIRRPSSSSTICASVSAGCPARSGRSPVRSSRRPHGREWPAASSRPSWRRSRRRARGRCRRSPGRRPAPRRGRSWPRSTATFRFARDGVGGEQDAGGLREHHLLHHHGHLDLAVIEAVLQPVVTARSVNSEAQHRRTCSRIAAGPDDVQVRVLLPGEGGRRQILRGRAGSHGVRGVLAEPGERASDRRRQVIRGWRSPRWSGGSPR